MAKTYIIPARYFKITKTKSTISKQNKKSGRMVGRELTSGPGDGTFTRRVVKDYDYDKDGEKDLFKGQIYGRVSKSDVRGSKKSKGYVRQV